MEMSYSELIALLEEAYVRGWHGSLELKSRVAKELAEELAQRLPKVIETGYDAQKFMQLQQVSFSVDTINEPPFTSYYTF